MQDLLINRKKLAGIIKEELNLQPEDTVLDIGCGDGEIMHRLTVSANDIIGIDTAFDEHWGENVNLDIRYGDARKLSFQDNAFNKVYSSHTIEHIKELNLVMEECFRILKPHGVAVFIYPWELWRGMAHARGAWRKYKNPFLGYLDHVHKLNPKKVRLAANNANLLQLRSFIFFANTPQYCSVFKKY